MAYNKQRSTCRSATAGSKHSTKFLYFRNVSVQRSGGGGGGNGGGRGVDAAGDYTKSDCCLNWY